MLKGSVGLSPRLGIPVLIVGRNSSIDLFKHLSTLSFVIPSLINNKGQNISYLFTYGMIIWNTCTLFTIMIFMFGAHISNGNTLKTLL